MRTYKNTCARERRFKAWFVNPAPIQSETLIVAPPVVEPVGETMTIAGCATFLASLLVVAVYTLWSKPISTFGLLKITTLKRSSHMLVVPTHP
jgi:hypothetical protein